MCGFFSLTIIIISSHCFFVNGTSLSEKNLVLELEQYRVSPSRARKRDKSPSKLDSFVRTLEQERDHYRNECDVLQAMIRVSILFRWRSYVEGHWISFMLFEIIGKSKSYCKTVNSARTACLWNVQYQRFSNTPWCYSVQDSKAKVSRSSSPRSRSPARTTPKKVSAHLNNPVYM